MKRTALSLIAVLMVSGMAARPLSASDRFLGPTDDWQHRRSSPQTIRNLHHFDRAQPGWTSRPVYDRSRSIHPERRIPHRKSGRRRHTNGLPHINRLPRTFDRQHGGYDSCFPAVGVPHHGWSH